MRRGTIYLLGALFLLGGLSSGCSTTPKSASARETLRDNADTTLARFKRQKPGIDQELAGVPAYAVFPTIGKGGLGVGGAYGRGVMYEGGQPTGYCDVSQASIGFQAGGQSYAELLLFQDQGAVNRFKGNTAQVGAAASAVALTAGAQGRAQFDNGMAIYTLTNGGLMYEAAVNGQRFTYAAREAGLAQPGAASTASSTSPPAPTTQPQSGPSR